MCINSVKETCFSQKYQKWICLIFENKFTLQLGAYNNGLLQHPFIMNRKQSVGKLIARGEELCGVFFLHFCQLRVHIAPLIESEDLLCQHPFTVKTFK